MRCLETCLGEGCTTCQALSRHMSRMSSPRGCGLGCGNQHHRVPTGDTCGQHQHHHHQQQQNINRTSPSWQLIYCTTTNQLLLAGRLQDIKIVQQLQQEKQHPRPALATDIGHQEHLMQEFHAANPCCSR
jgi:hypothetical protein